MKSEQIKDYKRDYVRIYKEMTVTFSEFFEALKQLGFKEESNADYFRFKKRTKASVIEIPIRPLSDTMWKPSFLGFSHSLYLGGYIADPDDLAKMIEKNREKAKSNMVSA